MKNNNVLRSLAIIALLGSNVVVSGQLLSAEELKAGNYKELDRLLKISPTDKMIFFEEPDVFPMYPGGIDGVSRDFIANLVYPMKARRKGYEGQFAIQFVIEKDGKLSYIHPRETHGPVHELLKDAALQSISRMQRWYPAFKDNEPIRFLFTQPVIFKLTR